MSPLDRLLISAAVDLERRGVIPSDPEAMAEAVAGHVLAYKVGAVKFRLLSEKQAAAALADNKPAAGLGLFGIGSAFKKILKKAEDIVKPVLAPIAAGAASLIPGIGPALAPLVAGAVSSYRGTVEQQKALDEAGKAYQTYQQQLQAAGVPIDPATGLPANPNAPPAQAAPRMIAGIPENLFPWVAAGGMLALVLAVRK